MPCLEFFPRYANTKTLDFLIGQGEQSMPFPLPKEVVMSISQFVIDQEAGIENRDCLHGEKLTEKFRHHTKSLCEKAKTLKELSIEMDYHEGIRFRNEFAREFINFRDKCLDLLTFLRADTYSTREVSTEFRRAYIGFRVEFSTVLPELINQMDLTDSEYDFRRRVLHPQRALFY